MKKFAFIGAGSIVFTRNVVRDLLTFPAFEDAHLALMDIDPTRLEYAKRACEKIIREFEVSATVTTTMDRCEALQGADGVVCTIFNGGLEVWRRDLEIPQKYGVSMNIGDTRSVSGIFRAARHIPLFIEICREIEELCPNAVFLNYTNPMTMLCRAMQLHTKVNVTGLCHSVQGTAAMLARWLGVPYNEVKYTCAGVNHQAFYTELSHNGKDLYPALREKLSDPHYYDKERVRNEMFLRLGYYVTESSGHNSEYNAWFRKRPDLLKKYCSDHEGSHWNPGEELYSIGLYADKAKNFVRTMQEWIDTPLDKNAPRSNEYAAEIFNALLGDGKPIEFNGNVINDGCIPNLPADACVEIPVYASKHGLRKCYVGKLPDEIAILVNQTAMMENLAVDAIMEKNKQKLIRAVMMDPLSSAVLSLEEIENMCNELFEANKDYLGDWK
ncbi:MAG: alpha-galactosidase [Ruminococcaceae bacterium]|nr:alpha-galactosidase [Oscillospiraceae bacterium]